MSANPAGGPRSGVWAPGNPEGQPQVPVDARRDLERVDDEPPITGVAARSAAPLLAKLLLGPRHDFHRQLRLNLAFREDLLHGLLDGGSFVEASPRLVDLARAGLFPLAVAAYDGLMIITSVQNPRIKAAARLRDRGERASTGCFLVDGIRELKRALSANIVVVEAFVCESLAGETSVLSALDELERRSVPIVCVVDHVFAKVAYGDRGDGVVAVAKIPKTALNGLTLPAEPLVAVVEGMEKPGNLGAVLRCADGAGLAAVVAAEPRTDFFNPNVVRASLGTVFSMPIAAGDAASVKAWLRANGCRMLAARVDGGVLYTEASFRGACAIVLGSEAEGLSDAWRDSDVTAIRLPMHGAADSLNVSASAAVLFYEALRQRTG